MRPLRRGAVLALFIALASPVGAREDLTPEQRFQAQIAVCAVCHGADGVSPSPDIPSLAGQHQPYLFESLKELQGPRGSSDIMRAVTSQLGEDDLQRLANHFAAMPYRRPAQEVPKDAVVRGRDAYLRLCQICHHHEGRATTYGEYPLLAGQSLSYMLRTMGLILEGKRRVPAIKQDMLSTAPRERIEDAIHFFAAQTVAPDEVHTVVSAQAQERRPRRNRFKTP